MVALTKEEVKRIAHIARLAITDKEAEKFAKELDTMVGYAQQLAELDTDGVEPTTYVLDMKNVMRQDEPKTWSSREAALTNAPDKQDGQFRVPSILE
ncbi:MAG TPA: Asp-tRNA(Asn)/Glu-tRNA(Gln) amidotransferase subunit GatC [Bacillota bacterium]|nr:Asp-tRNA(Asn)/Glu-tRNA(Gln) amidotransferase subunit GatC [Bacillota bacterium]